MYCPSCGSEERQASQFCRACGVDLRAVRMSLERPDSITASAASARDEIGRAMADRIRAISKVGDLSTVAEEVLPEIEKFLESPEQKRLRRIRAGIIFTSIGLGGGILGLIWSAVANAGDVEVAALVGGAGITFFFIGLALMLNGLLFTKLRGDVADRWSDAQRQKLLDSIYTPPQARAADKAMVHSPTTSNLASEKGSVTEHTTYQLKRG